VISNNSNFALIPQRRENYPRKSEFKVYPFALFENLAVCNKEDTDHSIFSIRNMYPVSNDSLGREFLQIFCIFVAGLQFGFQYLLTFWQVYGRPPW
jgi:hypothetical protein